MSEFVIKKIFNVMQVNSLLDRFYYEIEKGMPEVAVNEVICLTGRAAAELQGADPQPCHQVVFLTNDADLYSFIQKALPKKLPNNGVLLFKERTVFYLDSLVLEVWFQAEAIEILLRSGVYVQNIDDINEILL